MVYLLFCLLANLDQICWRIVLSWAREPCSTFRGTKFETQGIEQAFSGNLGVRIALQLQDLPMSQEVVAYSMKVEHIFLELAQLLFRGRRHLESVFFST